MPLPVRYGCGLVELPLLGRIASTSMFVAFYRSGRRRLCARFEDHLRILFRRLATTYRDIPTMTICCLWRLRTKLSKPDARGKRGNMKLFGTSIFSVGKSMKPAKRFTLIGSATVDVFACFSIPDADIAGNLPAQRSWICAAIWQLAMCLTSCAQSGGRSRQI